MRCSLVCALFSITLASFGVILYFTSKHVFVVLLGMSSHLTNNSAIYDQWVKPTEVNLSLRFYFWNVTNPDEISQGGKPIVKEVGPFVYTEVQEKWNISYSEHQDLVTYKNNRTYYFDRNASVADHEISLTLLNLPFWIVGLSSAAMLKDIQKSFPNIVTPFYSVSPKNITWGSTDPIMYVLNSLTGGLVSSEFGLYLGQNYSFDGVYEIATGVGETGRGIIKTWNGNSSVDLWSTKYANEINGTDGEIYPINVPISQPLLVFNSDICRSIALEFDHFQYFMGLNVASFNLPYSALANNSDNAGFCTPTVTNCLPGGLLNVTLCRIKPYENAYLPIRASIIMSQPHFLYNKELAQEFNMKPIAEKHGTFVDIHPDSGIIVNASKRAQISSYIDSKDLSSILPENFTLKTFFPVFWNEEIAISSPEMIKELKMAAVYPLIILKLAAAIFISFGLILACISILIYFFNGSTIVAEDVEPLIVDRHIES